MKACREARSVAEIEWDRWQPVDLATLLFVVDGRRILLMRKKRGLGAGKINGPGGRVEPGESPIEAAMREVREELVVEPLDVSHAGELRFQFVDGYSIHVQVFHAAGVSGRPRETDEAAPLWVDRDAIPYDEMWEDDRLWLPLLLERRRFRGVFIFDGDRMVDHRLEGVDERPVRRRQEDS